jgi:hypothetical protein
LLTYYKIWIILKEVFVINAFIIPYYEYFWCALIQFFLLLFASAASAEMISQHDRAEESYAGEVNVKPDPDYKEDECVYELVQPLRVDKTVCVSDSDTVEDTCLSNDSDCKKLVNERFTAAKMVSTRSSLRLAQKAQKMLQPRKGVGRLEVPGMLNKPIPSELNFRPLQPKSSSIEGQEAAGNMHPTRIPTSSENPQPKDSKSKSTITVLQPYEASTSMASVGSVRYVRDILSSCKAEIEASTSLPTAPHGKVPISRLKSSVSSKGQVQPSQLQANLLSTGNVEQLQAFLSSLVGSGQLQTLIPSTSSLTANKQISSKTETQVKEEALVDAVNKSKHNILGRGYYSLKPKQVLKSSVVGTNRAFTPSGKVAISQKEQQFVSPGQIKMTVLTSSNPKPDSVNPYGQLQAGSSSSVAGDLGQMQIPVCTSSVGQIHTVQIPYAVGTSHNNFQAILPPFQAVLPSVAGSSQVFQFRPVIAPVSSGQINTLVPPSGTHIQLQAVIPSTGMFSVVNRHTSN